MYVSMHWLAMRLAAYALLACRIPQLSDMPLTGALSAGCMHLL